MRLAFPCGGWGLLPAAILLLTGAPAASAQQLSPEAAAQMVLDSARRAYNEGKYPFAAERFREFLRQYGGHKDAPAAQFGLALSLLDAPQKDYPSAISALEQVVGRQDFPDRPRALHCLGSAIRALGGQSLEQIPAKPNEAGNLRNAANQQFERAQQQFSAAADAFAARVQSPPAGATPQTIADDQQWGIRSRCDRCEMLLRLEKFKDAADLAKTILADKAIENSRFRSLAAYHLGYASFALRDYLAAGRALATLAPFQQEFGVHARYLLARTHHLAEERPEALALYKALLADYDQQRKTAVEAMKSPDALKPEDRARLETLAKGPPPDYIPRAAFHAALVQAEEGRYGEALEGLTALLQQNPKGPLAEEAQLRQGFCQLQLRNWPEANKALQPLQNHPELADRALWWLARAQVGAADVNNAQAYEQALRGAIDLLNRAADRAGELGRNDPDAKIRRGDILLEVADTQQMARLYRDAAGTYQKVLSENNNPDRAEEAMQRWATALHLAGQWKESDDVCQKFEQTYPQSTLLAAVWFRAAENTCLSAVALANDSNQRGRRAEINQMFDEAIKRYQRLLTKYPEFAYVNLARFGLATAYYQKGQYPEAIGPLSAIADADRMGDLASVPYLLADCYLRGFPAETDDALEAEILINQAEEAAKLLEKYVASQPKSPQTPDALLKLGYCHQRIGMLLADPVERQKLLTMARQTYERLMQEFGNSPAQPAAVMERARCQALLGDVNGAINELNRFQSDPLKNTPVAPLALIRLSSLMRSENRAVDAVNVMNQCRGQHEGGLQSDPERKAWVPQVQYEQALAVKESGKLADARGMFEAIAKQFVGSPEGANAQWRAGQCRREEMLAAIATARGTVTKPGVKPEEMAAAVKSIEDGLAALRQTAEEFKTAAAKLQQAISPAAGGTSLAGQAHLRMLYESAWCSRVLAEAEIETARQKLQAQALEKIVNQVKKGSNQSPVLNPPEVPLALVPLQPSEQAARDQYTALIAAAKGTPLGARARLELAEVYSQRGEHDRALDSLAPALDNSPPPELADRVRLRSAVCLLAKNDAKAALALTQVVLKNPASPAAAEARYLAGEAYFQAKDWPNAIQQFQPFKDQDPFRSQQGLADRALLRMGQALAEAQRWDESRQALEALVQRFNQSPWIYEARFGIGWAWQNQNQHDNAVNAYNEVIRGTAAEVAARAQLQVGRCRLAQKRFQDAAKELLTVPFTYEYPEPRAAALCEAGQAHWELKQVEEATKVWKTVVAEYAASPWAEVAKQRLSAIK